MPLWPRRYEWAARVPSFLPDRPRPKSSQAGTPSCWCSPLVVLPPAAAAPPRWCSPCWCSLLLVLFGHQGPGVLRLSVRLYHSRRAQPEPPCAQLSGSLLSGSQLLGRLASPNTQATTDSPSPWCLIVFPVLCALSCVPGAPPQVGPER